MQRQLKTTTRTTIILASAALSSALLVACSDGRDGTTQDTASAVADTAPPADAGYVPADTVSPDSVAQPAIAMASGGTAETLGLVATIDQHEIDAAKQAKSKDVDPKIKAYADMLIKDHTEDLEKTRAVAMTNDMAVGDGAKVHDLEVKGRDSLATLADKQGKDYATAYIDMMVEGHTDALSMLDERLPDVDNDAIKAHLTKTRDAVQKHLERAKELQQGM